MLLFILNRVSNVSSMSSQFALKKCNKELQHKFTNPAITMEELKSLMQSFVEYANSFIHSFIKLVDWSNYLGMIDQLTDILQKQFECT